MNIQKYKDSLVRKSRKLQKTLGTVCFHYEKQTWEQAYTYLNSIHRDCKSSCCRYQPTAFLQIQYDLSVIMPTYNRAELVTTCIDSLLSQQSSYNIQYIFVNDGSWDHTAEVLKPYASRENIKVINQENMGLSGARNTGIQAAEGKYLLFVDDDDFLVPGALEKLLNGTKNGYYDVVEGPIVRVNRYGQEERDVYHYGPALHPFESLHGFACGKLYRREIFTNIQFPLQYWFEDSVNAGIIFGDALKACVVEGDIYKYIETEQSITASSCSLKNLDSLYITMQLLEDRKKLGLPIRQENYEHFLRMIDLTYIRTENLENSIKSAVFEVFRHIFSEYYQDFQTEKDGYLKKIEGSLLNGNFRTYVLACSLHRG